MVGMFYFDTVSTEFSESASKTTLLSVSLPIQFSVAGKNSANLSNDMYEKHTTLLFTTYCILYFIGPT